jgi:hypothetical protein
MSSPADIYMVTGGGLMSYAPNLVDQLRRAAGYASTPDQIRAGHQPQDRQSARPRRTSALLARADAVIE